MPLCVGVAFKRVAKSYWFDPDELDLQEEDRVIVETTRGLEMGQVKIGPRTVVGDEIQAPLKRVIRRAVDLDFEQERQNRKRARESLVVCQERVKALGLPMKLLQAEYTFDSSQVTIYFAAESRVDFRELVREVASQLRCKVQLHQVGPRDQAKIIGGVGPCGLTLCCSSFLTEFAPVSMKMAKDQSLFLNPVKFSGVCGKLMCCLRYEQEDETITTPRLPEIGATVMTPRGQGKVLDVHLKTEIVLVQIFEGREELSFPAAELRVERIGKCTDCRGCSVNQLQTDAEETAMPEPERSDMVAPDAATRLAASRIATARAASATPLFEDEE